jgi:hypothetical protein
VYVGTSDGNLRNLRAPLETVVFISLFTFIFKKIPMPFPGAENVFRVPARVPARSGRGNKHGRTFPFACTDVPERQQIILRPDDSRRHSAGFQVRKGGPRNTTAGTNLKVFVFEGCVVK